MKPDAARTATRRVLAQTVAGWAAVSLSTMLASAWAFWGANDNFHEGWYHREVWRNVALACVQYRPWTFVPIVGGLLALWAADEIGADRADRVVCNGQVHALP